MFFYTAPLGPTAAAISFRGRIVTPKEYGLPDTQVTLTDMRGIARTTVTGKFGTFNFNDLPVGETYILSVSSKLYSYAPLVFTPNENVSEIVLMPQ